MVVLLHDTLTVTFHMTVTCHMTPDTVTAVYISIITQLTDVCCLVYKKKGRRKKGTTCVLSLTVLWFVVTGN